MIIYSVEILISKHVSEKWVQWMHTKHIPDVMNTGLFLQFKVYKNWKTNNKVSYIIQYRTDRLIKYLQYVEKYAKKLQEEHSKKFKSQFSATRSLFIQIH
tara:strand:+ start:297 stop:596 length:300 start_codon:yes stop_codon:yes gene_type:complete